LKPGAGLQLKYAGPWIDIAAPWFPPNVGCMKAPAHVVIYEEDFLTRGLLEEWLREAGYRVRSGNTCDAGRDGPCDLLIVSVYMPKHTGPQCVRDIQAAHPGTPVIAISGQFRPGLAAAGTTAQALSVQQVVAKPLTRQKLLDCVHGILGTSS
jgi:DNA-binding NtrC family response regulator